MDTFSSVLNSRLKLFSSLSSLSTQLDVLVDLMVKTLESGHALIWAGNGGSAADSQHLAAELVGRFKTERPPLRSFSLTADSSILTSLGNDYGYEYVFSRQLQAIGNTGDLLICLSTSGASPNILQLLNTAQALGVITAGLYGKSGGQAAPLTDYPLIIQSDCTASIQECHILIGHWLCSRVENRLYHV